MIPLRLILLIVWSFGLVWGETRQTGDPCYRQPPRACEITPFSEWSDCFPTCLRPGEPSGSRYRIRIRGVSQYPCPDTTLCPPFNLTTREYRACPDAWCSPNNLKCQERCTDCQYNDAFPVLSEDWCRCCANQDSSGHYYRNNPCTAYGRSGEETRSIYSWDPPAVGCNFLPWSQGSSSYNFDRCLAQGFCLPVNSTYKGCQQLGYCEGA